MRGAAILRVARDASEHGLEHRRIEARENVSERPSPSRSPGRGSSLGRAMRGRAGATWSSRPPGLPSCCPRTMSDSARSEKSASPREIATSRPSPRTRRSSRHQKSQIGIAPEGGDHRREDFQDRFASRAGAGRDRLRLLVRRSPALVEYRLEGPPCRRRGASFASRPSTLRGR